MMVMGGRGDAGVVLPNVEILDVDDPFALGWQVSLLLERRTKVVIEKERWSEGKRQRRLELRKRERKKKRQDEIGI